jgi:hypothetical protein
MVLAFDKLDPIRTVEQLTAGKSSEQELPDRLCRHLA